MSIPNPEARLMTSAMPPIDFASTCDQCGHARERDEACSER